VKLIITNGGAETNVIYLAVRLMSPNKAKHSDSFSVAALPSLQSCACWQR
jgi:hypothetical protein